MYFPLKHFVLLIRNNCNRIWALILFVKSVWYFEIFRCELAFCILIGIKSLLDTWTFTQILHFDFILQIFNILSLSLQLVFHDFFYRIYGFKIELRPFDLFLTFSSFVTLTIGTIWTTSLSYSILKITWFSW